MGWDGSSLERAELEMSEVRTGLLLLWVWVLVGLALVEEMDSLRRMMERGWDWRFDRAARVEFGDDAIVT